MPVSEMILVGAQVRSRVVKGVVKLKVEVMSLEIHDQKYRGNSSGKLAEGLVDIFALHCDTLAEFFAVK